MSAPEQELLDAAEAVMARAYAPYSGYCVGAAIRDEKGRIWTGCNVENISYGVTICAERSALAALVSGGSALVTAVAVVTRDGGTPCGMCLQALLEFSPEPSSVAVYTASPGAPAKAWTLAELLPHAFRSDAVSRTIDGSSDVEQD
ncbi:MAG TPA: cytidine deaminase [Fimbriimonadaceae bacterium]|nr:cytidine deaminase [Fimbriimonadaceae bacterium]